MNDFLLGHGNFKHEITKFEDLKIGDSFVADFSGNFICVKKEDYKYAKVIDISDPFDWKFLSYELEQIFFPKLVVRKINISCELWQILGEM